MITKNYPTLKEFEEYITKIKEFRKSADNFAEALSKLTDEHRICLNGREEDLMVRMLEKLMDDKWNNISWWIYEKDWGRKKNFDYKNKGKIIPTKTIKNLYDLITKEL